MNVKVIAGLAATNLLFFWLWLGARDDVATAIEQCNTEKMTSIAEAERITREATTAGLEGRIEELEQMSLDAAAARDIAIAAREAAEARPAEVRTVIRRVADEDACIDTNVHPELLSCLRDDQDCAEAGPG